MKMHQSLATQKRARHHQQRAAQATMKATTLTQYLLERLKGLQVPDLARPNLGMITRRSIGK